MIRRTFRCKILFDFIIKNSKKTYLRYWSIINLNYSFWLIIGKKRNSLFCTCFCEFLFVACRQVFFRPLSIIQLTSMASEILPWFGSIQYFPWENIVEFSLIVNEKMDYLILIDHEDQDMIEMDIHVEDLSAIQDVLIDLTYFLIYE